MEWLVGLILVVVIGGFFFGKRIWRRHTTPGAKPKTSNRSELVRGMFGNSARRIGGKPVPRIGGKEVRWMNKPFNRE